MSDPKGWELFDASFKVGDEVVLVCVDDTFHWGMLINVEERELTLKRVFNKEEVFGIDDIRFMAHDGFPVRKVLGADGREFYEGMNTDDTQRAILKAFDEECGELTRADEVERWLREPRARFGDPFEVEAASARLYYPGNSGPGYWSKFWNELTGSYHSEEIRQRGYETEEVLVLDSGDGARAHLWDLTTVYAFEVSR